MCLSAMATLALRIPEASKLTLHKDLTVFTPHNVGRTASFQRELPLSDNQLLTHQALGQATPVDMLLLNPAAFYQRKKKLRLKDMTASK